MRTRALLPLLALGLGLGVWSAPRAPAADKPDGDKIDTLIKQLGSDDFDEREKATAELDAAGAPALDALRRAAKSSDDEVRKRAGTLVSHIEKRLESANALAAKHVRLTYKDTPVAEAVEDFAKKTGYLITLNDPDNKLKDRKVTLDTGDVTFWQALDQFCDKAGLKEADSAAGPAAPPGPVGVPAPPPVPRIRRGGAAPPPQAVPPAAAPPAPPVAAQPGVAVGPAVPAPINNPDEIVLEDGKPDRLPMDASTAVRVRAQDKADQFGQAPDGEILLGLRLSLEPKLQWQGVDKVTITKAVDDQKQELAQAAGDVNPAGGAAPGGVGGGAPAGVGRAVILPFPGPGAGFDLGGINRDVAVHLRKGDKPAKSLTELAGTVSAQVLGEVKPVITVENILKLKDADKTARGGENGSIKIAEVSHNDNGQITISLELQPPADVVPAGGAAPVNGPFRIRPNRRMPVPAPVPPAAGVAGAIAFAPGGAIIVGPGGMNGAAVGGLALLDDKGDPIKQTGTQMQFRSTNNNGVVTTSQLYVLTFQADKGQEASKLVYNGRKLLSVEIPFALKDVPLP